MPGLEFAILQHIDTEKFRLIRRWNEETLRAKLQEHFAMQTDAAEYDVGIALDLALTHVIQEFKDETIRIV